jgi:hypothetical protein
MEMDVGWASAWVRIVNQWFATIVYNNVPKFHPKYTCDVFGKVQI